MDSFFLLCGEFVKKGSKINVKTKDHIVSWLFVVFCSYIEAPPYISEYRKFTGQLAHSLEYTKQVVWRAFERLQSGGLVCPTEQRTTASSVLPKEYRKMTLILSRREVKEAVQTYPNCPTDLQQWSQKSGAA